MSDGDDDLGQRHLLGAPGLAQPGSRPAWRVRIDMSPAWAATKSGQFLASALVNLLCRQIGIVSHIEVIAAAVPSLIVGPDGRTFEQFSDLLEALPLWAVDNKTTLSLGLSEKRIDFTVFIGPPSGPSSTSAIAALGDGWRAWVGEAPQAPAGVRPASDNPLGPLLAAALAAGEVFKHHCGLTRGNFLTCSAYSLWSAETSDRWDSVGDGPQAVGCKIPPFYLMGTGAVGNDVSYILGYLKTETYAVLIDNQVYGKTNLNRCLVSGWADRDQDKVKSVARFLKACGIGSYLFRGTVKEFIAAPRFGLREDVAKAADDLEFGIVLSCVDNSVARHDIQGFAPTWLLGGSSLGLQAKTQFYSGLPGAPCLACFHPIEANAERFAALKEQLRAMTADTRRTFLIANKLDVAAVDKYLQDPDCGGLGEAALRDFVTAPPDEFSVSFVSLGSALLLAASLLRRLIFAANASARDDFSTLSFLNGHLHDHAVAADDACERRCQKSPV